MQARFYFFSPLDFDTVFRTQVIGWVNLFREHGLDCTIVKLSPARLISPGRTRSDRRGIRELYDGRLAFLYTLPDKYFVTRLANALLMLAVISPALISGKTAVIQIRSSALHRTLAMMKKITGRRLKIIYDSRAAAAEEYIYSQKEPGVREKAVYERMKDCDRQMTALSDRVFCVSSVLADYHISLSQGRVVKGKFFLYPGNADEGWFHYSAELRKSVRDELGIGTRFVVTYSGGLEMPWHVPDLLFRFFRQISAITDDAILLILSGDRRLALEYASKHGIEEDRILILSADNRQVHRYLNASDLGTLFRTDDIMNRVSSPTKFAEYLMCGLPVAISPSVGDLSGVIEKTGWGMIYQGEVGNDADDFIRKRLKWSADRSMISRYGYEYFSKQAVISGVLRVYEELQSRQAVKAMHEL